jgi:hypothetical protein
MTFCPVRTPGLDGDPDDESQGGKKEDQSPQELRRQLCSQLRRSIVQLEKLSFPQSPKLRPTPETAAATEHDHVQVTIGATTALLPD